MQEIGLIGGTGDLGRALAIHLAKKYDIVYIGSRSLEKAEGAVKEIISEKGDGEHLTHLKAATNEDTVRFSDTVIATIPYDNVIETIRQLIPSFKGNQVLISAAARVRKIGNEFYPAPDGPSLSQQIRAIIPASVILATAFQTVPANILYKEKPISADVFVACESSFDYEKVAAVVSAIEGIRPLYLGSLELAGEIERLTAVLLNIAIKNHLKSPTLKVNSF
ncbi:MAG: NAD(P)-binding domain-containing protein [Nitrososphaerales archaeon]